MKIIISPAKKMQVNSDILDGTGTPAFLERTEELKECLASMNKDQLKDLFQANDKITELNYYRYQNMKLTENLTPAVLAYVGIQYQSMAPNIFTTDQWEYVKQHLYIISGFYGLLKADDGVVPYRLEMQAKLKTKNAKDLYEYWGDSIYRELIRDKKEVIVNLASKEYSKAVQPFADQDTPILTCVFGTLQGGKVKVKATEAKMARGFMVSFMARENAGTPEDLKKFSEGGYCFSEERSDMWNYVFLK